MLRLLLAAFFLCGSFLSAPAALADTTSPLGLWLINDRQAVIDITSCGTGICGRIAGITLNHPTDPTPRDWRGQPQCGDAMLAMTPVPGTPDKWRGTVTDPRNGNIWSATLRLVDGSLLLHGYVALPLFGQTQSWPRYTGQIFASCLFTAAG